MKWIYLIAFIVLCGAASAQTTGTLKGKLVDTVGKQSLKDATVTLLDAEDSTLEIFVLAAANGEFEMKNISFGTFILQINFQGYTSFHKKVSFTKEKPLLEMGTIYLQPQASDLNEVVVQSARPIVMKKDTVEYNASSFKTKPNAVVEDLIKKLPGMEVAKDGSVKAQGETVTRILVDGKRFFGDDPKMATKNLPPDIIDKIQVFDDQSDQSKFTGFDDGNRVKTINITTKKDKRKGFFGKGVVGGGANEDNALYDNNLNLSHFNNNQQMTLLAQANNVNKQNFSKQDILGARGSGTSGITKTIGAGLNYRDMWGKKTDVSDSYFYNDQSTDNASTSLSQNLINQDSTTFTTRGSSSLQNNENHRFNFNIEHMFDSSNSIIIRPNLSTQHTSSTSNDSSNATESKAGGLIYNSVSNSTRENTGYNGTVEATFRHRFAKKGRTYSIGVTLSGNTNNGDGNNYSFITYPTRFKTVNQQFNSTSNSNSVSTTLSYTEPVGRNQLIELNYNYSFNNSNSNRTTYNYNTVSKDYDLRDSLLSNQYENNYKSNRVTLSYRIQGAKYTASVGSGIQYGERESHNLSKAINIGQQFTNLYPTANFNYEFSKTKSLRFFYNGRTAQPSINQLQPLVTTTDSINIRSGNPDLKQQFTHTFRLLYRSFDNVTQRVIFATINASIIQNDIQNSVTQYTNGRTLTIPVNLNGTYSLNGYFNYGFPLKNPKSNLNFSTNVSYNQNQNLVTNVDNSNVATTISNYTKNTSLGETISWTTNLKDNFDMNFSSNSNYNIARQTLQSNQNANYFTQTLSTEVTYYTNSGWILSTDFDYIYSAGRSAGYNNSVPLWNASIAKQLFKKKEGEIRFFVFDLLNQNVSYTRTLTLNTVQDVKNKVLTRYCMLTFTYNLRKFGQKGDRKQNRDGIPTNIRRMQNGGGNRGGGGGGRSGGGGRFGN